MNPIEFKYPSPREVIPFEQWVPAVVLDDWSTIPNYLLGDLDHRENWLTYSEYQLILYEHAKELLVDQFELAQIGQFLGRFTRWDVLDGKLPAEMRLRGWDSVRNVYVEVFEPYAERDKEVHSACFMFWDNCFVGAIEEEIDAPGFFSLCAYCLASDSEALQRSALHGLGHFLFEDSPCSARGCELIDGFTAGRPNLDAVLRRYAEEARAGNVL